MRNRCKDCCLGFIPFQFFCLIIPLSRALRVVSLCSILLFFWNFIFSVFLFSVTARIRAQHRLDTDYMYTALALFAVIDLIMILVTILLVARRTHLLWMAWMIIGFFVQGIGLAVSAYGDTRQINKEFLVFVTSTRVLAALDVYLICAVFGFTWTVGVYLWLCVFSHFQIIRLPDNYDELLAKKLKTSYEKSRERMANMVMQQTLNEEVLRRAEAMAAKKEDWQRRRRRAAKSSAASTSATAATLSEGATSTHEDDVQAQKMHRKN